MMRNWLIAIGIVLVQSAFSQIPSKRCHNFIAADGNVYFFKPYKVAPKQGNDTKLEYDMTYIVTKEDVTLNFSFTSPIMEKVSAFQLCNATDTLQPTKISMLYVDPKKNGYEYRYTCIFPYESIQRLYNNPQTPLTFRIQQGSKYFCHSDSKSAWSKEAKLMKQIFELINFQKK